MPKDNNYLYKDLFSYKGLKKPDVIQKLVRALALQLGSEVSYNELSNLLGIDKETVENYICLLEKCFVVFRLDSFSRNLRNEIKKGIYLLLQKEAIATVTKGITAGKRLTEYLHKKHPKMQSLGELDRDIFEEYLIHLKTDRT